MNQPFYREFQIYGLIAIMSAFVGLGPAAGQEDATEPDPATEQEDATELEDLTGQDDDYLTGDVPEWLEDFGYEDTHDDGPAPRAATQGRGGASKSAASRKCDCIKCRNKLTGDWGGFRSSLQQEGIAYRGRVTQHFFGVGGGVNPPVAPPFAALGIAGGDTFEYTGNSRHDFLLDLDKFGGLPHSKFVVTMENVWGRWGNVSFETGAYQPPIFNALMPVDPEANGVPRFTNLMYVQPLSEQFIVTVGKTRNLGIADNNKFAGGDGSDQFQNQTFIANPLMFPQVPFSTFVVSAQMPQEWGNVSLAVMDPEERSTEFMAIDTLFSTGAILFGQVQVDTDFFDMPGEVHVGGLYKEQDQLDLRFTSVPPTYPYPPAPPGTAPFLTRSETSGMFCGFDQYLVTYGPPDARGNTEGWGLFGRASIADGATGNPNWGAWHASLGIGGDSPLKQRRGKGDRFGVGYGYTGAARDFGAIPQFLFAPRDSQAVEMYYRYSVTPAIEVTPDVQWIRGTLGGLTDGDDAIVAGIRLNMKL